MQLSDNLILKMGFDLSKDGETIEGAFYRLEVYEVFGAKINESSLEREAALINQTPISVCMGSSLNAVCRALSGEDYIEDESEWRKEMSCSGSLVIVAIGPTSAYCREVRFRKYEDGQVLTFDAFNDAKNELQKMSDAVVPQVIASFSAATWTEDTHVNPHSPSKSLISLS